MCPVADTDCVQRAPPRFACQTASEYSYRTKYGNVAESNVMALGRKGLASMAKLGLAATVGSPESLRCATCMNTMKKPVNPSRQRALLATWQK